MAVYVTIGYELTPSLMMCEGDDCVSIVSGSHNIEVQDTYCGKGCHGIRYSTSQINLLFSISLPITIHGCLFATLLGYVSYLRG